MTIGLHADALIVDLWDNGAGFGDTALHFGMGIQETLPPVHPYPVKGREVIGIEPAVAVPGAEAFAVPRTLAKSRIRRQ